MAEVNVGIICSCLPVVFIVFRPKTGGILEYIKKYISSRWTYNSSGQSNKKLASCKAPSEDVVYQGQLPSKLPTASRNLVQGRGHTQTKPHSRNFIERLEYDELETLDHEPNT